MISDTEKVWIHKMLSSNDLDLRIRETLSLRLAGAESRERFMKMGEFVYQ